MKKIISIMLLLACALTCSFALASCDEPVVPESNEVAFSDVSATFIAAVNATDANTIDATIKVEVQGETLNAAYHTVKNSDGTQTMNYAVEVINGAESAEHKSVVTGEAVSNTSGEYTDENAKAFGANGIKLNLAAYTGTDFDASANVLRFNVAANDTAAVLGAAVGADAVVVVTISEGVVVSVTVNYQTSASTVEIVCEYNKPVTE